MLIRPIKTMGVRESCQQVHLYVSRDELSVGRSQSCFQQSPVDATYKMETKPVWAETQFLGSQLFVFEEGGNRK